MKLATGLAMLALVTFASIRARAEGTVVVPAGAGQLALAVKPVDGAFLAHACTATAGCDAEGGTKLVAPADVAPDVGRVRFSTVTLSDGKRVAWIEVLPSKGPVGAAWIALVAAPLAGGDGDPVVVWNGWTGLARGEEGETRVNVILREPAGRGERIVVGQRREDVTLCGRPLIVGARELDPATLSLKGPASLQSIEAADRARAKKIAATRAPEAPAPAIPLLKVKDASSAVDHHLAAITDGDPETVWSEDTPGIGRGEWIRLSSASEVGIRSLELAIRPKRDVPEGVAPKTLFVAADGGRLFEVRLPEDGWRAPGSRFLVTFPEEVRTSCLGVVLDDAYAPAGAKNARVSIGEVIAHTALDALDPPGLVAALSGGGDHARAAAALLDRSRGGAAATQAAIDGYRKLDEAGKELAIGAIDTAPCSDKVAFFAERLAQASPKALHQSDTGPDTFADGEVRHARDRLRQCKREAAPSLAKLVQDGAVPSKILAAKELADIAPERAIGVLLDAMATANEPTRRELRAALATAARNGRAADAVADELTPARFGARPVLVRIDLLRAVGPNLGLVRGSADALRTIAAADPSFRGRYLLQAPAAELARAGDKSAEAYVRDALRRDGDPHVRARAAEFAARVPTLAADIVAAVDDSDVRVREAAIDALAESAVSGRPPPAAEAPLVRRLGGDPWTFVRTGAAHALGALPGTAAADRALASALADASPDVRGAVLDALAAHRAIGYIKLVRERADDKGENVDVRARAILAQSAMCDRASINAWTKLAVGLLQPQSDDDRRLGTAALAALAIVHPPDLARRIEPLLANGVPPWVRQIARATLSTTPGCR